MSTQTEQFNVGDRVVIHENIENYGRWSGKECTIIEQKFGEYKLQLDSGQIGIISEIIFTKVVDMEKLFKEEPFKTMREEFKTKGRKKFILTK